MDNLVAGRQHEFEHIVHQPVDVAAGNFRVIAFTGKDTAVLQTFDVLAGNADVYGTELHARLPFGDFHRFADGVHCFFDVADDATQDAYAFDFADTDNFEFSMTVPAASEAAYLCGTDVQGNDHIMGLWEQFRHNVTV
jgi:hypothetical protein